MSWLKTTFNSSVGKKFAMALSALFLITFLLLHVAVNTVSVFSEELYNEMSHFMGTNMLVQIFMQPILIAGVIYHFVMGFVLERQNRSARSVKYAMYKGEANSSWVSRNMIYSGLVILGFIALHFYDFWFPEINTKYIAGDMSGLNAEGQFRYFEELIHKFESPVRVGLYVVAFVFLMLHLLHGFQSAFQSLGARHPKYFPFIQSLGKVFAIGVPALFIFIAVWHHFNHF